MDIFCKIINGEIPSKKLYEDEVVMVIMDVNPRSNGHCLVIPKKHYKNIFDIDNDTLIHIFDVARDISKVLEKKLHCNGITLEENNGDVQEVKHFHLHIIPRYKYEDIAEVEEIYNVLTN
jgi:histidine triad (HIT) family protein